MYIRYFYFFYSVLTTTLLGCGYIAAVPSAPTITTISGGDSKITMNFIPGVLIPGASPVTSYAASCTNSGHTTSASSSSSPIVVTGLTNGKEYFCQLSAANSAGQGAISSKFYATPLAASCVLKNYSPFYPSSYLGAHPIPVPSQKFDAHINRMIGLKDYYPTDGVNGCSSEKEYSRLIYTYTLERLQALGVDTVEIYQYGPVEDFNAPTWVINESGWQIPKSELIWFIQAAHRKNIKVTLVWQLWASDSRGNSLNTTNPTEFEMIKVLRGWRDIMLVLANLATESNIDNLNIQWSAFYYPIVQSFPESATQEFLSIISMVRSAFNGKIFMGTPRFYDERIVNKVDAIVIPLTPISWNYADDSIMSVLILKQRYLEKISSIQSDFSMAAGINSLNTPIIWDFNIQSRDKALSDGWVEDGFCISSIGGPIVAWGAPNCMQKNYVTDFSLQAQAIQGAFEAIKEQQYFKSYGVNFSTGYWHTDTLTPGNEGFPNFSQSIRGKPSEIIVKQWYTR